MPGIWRMVRRMSGFIRPPNNLAVIVTRNGMWLCIRKIPLYNKNECKKTCVYGVIFVNLQR